MSDEVTVAIRLTMQWLFAPLLAIVALAWLCVRLKAAGVFNVIRDSIRKMSIFQRFAAATFLAVFIVFAGEKTNSPPANLPPVILPSVPAVPPEPPRSGAFEVTNLCFTSISVASNETTLGVSWHLDFIGSGSKIDLFAFTSLDAAEQTWLAEHEVASAETNWTLTVDTSCLATGTDVYPPMLFFSTSVRADPGDLRDTDGDTMPDVYEVHNGTNPYVPDYALAPKLTVGPLGTYADIAAAFAASTNYSIVELDSTAVHAVGGIGVPMPAHPVMVCSPPGACAVVRATGLSAFLFDTNSTSRTLFKNIYILLDAQSGVQAGFWVGGDLPWNGVAATASFEDVYVRMPRTGVEYFGWLLYSSSDDAVTLSRCTVNASGSEWVYGVQSFGASPFVMENCSFVNFPPNGAKTSCGILLRSMPGIGGGADVAVSRCLFDESFTNAVMFGRLEGGESNVLSVADCIVPRNPLEDYPLDEFSGLEVTNAALSWAGFPWPDSPPVSLDIGALSPLANDPAFDTDGDGLPDYEEVYTRGTDPFLADSDLDGVRDETEVSQGTDPTDPHSFIQNLHVSVTNTVSLTHAAYVAWGNSPDDWETNGLVGFQSGTGTNLYVNASSNGAVYVKSFCDLDDDGDFDPSTDILIVRPIPQGSVVHISFVFGDVDGDGVSDERERSVDHTGPYNDKNFRLVNAKVSYTDVDPGHGYTNIIALSHSPDCWNADEAVAYFTSTAFTYTVDAVVTGGVLYVKCLRDLDGDGELDIGVEQMVTTRLTAASRGKTENVTIGDYDGDGVADSQELLDGTDPYDAKNFRLNMRIDVATSDPVVSCTNYLAVSSSPSGWLSTTVVTSFVCTSVSAYVEGTATNGFVYVKCLRDFNANGTYDMTGDVLYTVQLTARSNNVYVMGVGDRDGDGICDSDEILEGTNPNDGMESCFSLNATVTGIFAPSNELSAIVYFDAPTNVLYGPCVQNNATLTVDCGHLSTMSRERVSFLFWEDMDGNGVWNLGERKAVCMFRVTEHTMCATNVLELGDFDADGDGMLDDWEVAHGLSPANAADAVQDADSDGFINLYEYIAGTDPNDSADDGTGTALYAATHGVDDRIAVAPATTSVSSPFYSDYPWEGKDVTNEIQNVSFAYNTNCWMYGVDMTCMSIWEDRPPGEWRIAYTAITPQHVISATHVSLQNGVRMTFQSKSGEVVVRTLVAQTFIPGIADNDFWIGLLDTPLPPCIKPARFLSPCYARYIGSGRKLPLVRIGRDKTCNIHDIIYLAPSDRNQRMCCLQYSANANRFNYRRGPWAMDSGHPLFILFGNELVFVCPTRGFYYSDNQATGFLCTYYKSLIQRAVDGLSDQHAITRMPIADFDFSQYGELYDMEMDP